MDLMPCLECVGLLFVFFKRVNVTCRVVSEVVSLVFVFSLFSVSSPPPVHVFFATPLCTCWVVRGLPTALFFRPPHRPRCFWFPTVTISLFLVTRRAHFAISGPLPFHLLRGFPASLCEVGLPKLGPGVWHSRRISQHLSRDCVGVAQL